MILVAAAKEGQNNKNNNNPFLLTNVQCWKDHAVDRPNSWNNSLPPAGGRNINIISRRSGSRNSNSTSFSRDIAADGSFIISGSLSGRESRQRKADFVSYPVVTLNSIGGDKELPELGVSEEEDTAESVLDNQNMNINASSK